jgi:peptidoglycan/xylan/chitin deacetylase (PgdA/CDA1 family)
VYRLRPVSHPRRIVLLYHAVGDSPLAVREAAFSEQITWLAAAAEILPLQELLKGASKASLQAAITFDDGYQSLYNTAYPILKDAGATATLFLNTGWIGQHTPVAADAALGHYPDEFFLTWPEVEHLAQEGWEIGSHGVDHLDLTVQADGIVRGQLTESRHHIEERIARCSPVFAYVSGRHTKHLHALVAGAGYSEAVAGIHGTLTAHTDPFAIPRINITRSYGLNDFKAIVHGDWDYLRWIQKIRPHRNWHAGMPNASNQEQIDV